MLGGFTRGQITQIRLGIVPKIKYATAQTPFEGRMRVAIIADKYLSTGFRLAGVAAFPAENAVEAASRLDEVLKDENYKVIILTEKLAEALKDKRDEIISNRRAYPVFAVIPDFEGSKRLREKELYQAVERAIGSKLRVVP